MNQDSPKTQATLNVETLALDLATHYHCVIQDAMVFAPCNEDSDIVIVPTPENIYSDSPTQAAAHDLALKGLIKNGQLAGFTIVNSLHGPEPNDTSTLSPGLVIAIRLRNPRAPQ